MIVPDDYVGFPLLLPDFYESRPYIRQSLELLGIQVHYYPIRKRLQVRHLVLPGHVALTGNYNESVIRRLRHRFLKDQLKEADPKRKIYVSRKMASKRRVLNEDEVTAVVKQFGYEVHYMENYSLSRQISLMLETRVLAGLHGAGLTNMLFMPQGGYVLELRNRADENNNCFFALALALDHHYFYLRDDGAEGRGPDVTIDIAAFSRTLQQIESYLSPSTEMP